MTVHPTADKMEQLEREVAAAVNRLSIDAHYNIPDFVLADFMTSAMVAFADSVHARDAWFGIHPRPAEHGCSNSGFTQRSPG